MTLSIVQANNPLALTISGPGYNFGNSTLYGGQDPSLNVSSPNGFTYAGFPTPQIGFQAGVDWLVRKFNGQTVGSVIGKAFNGDQKSVQAQGVNLNDPLTSSNAARIAAGITNNEGGFKASDLLSGLAGGPAAIGSSLGSSLGQSSGQTVAGWQQAIASFFSINTAQRGVAIFVGVVLVLAAVIILIAENKTVQQTVVRVGKAASLAAV